MGQSLCLGLWPFPFQSSDNRAGKKRISVGEAGAVTEEGGMVAAEAKPGPGVYPVQQSHQSAEKTRAERLGPGSQKPGLRLQIPWSVSTWVERNPRPQLTVVEFMQNPAICCSARRQRSQLVPSSQASRCQLNSHRHLIKRHLSFKRNDFSGTRQGNGQASSCSPSRFAGRRRESHPGPTSLSF